METAQPLCAPVELFHCPHGEKCSFSEAVSIYELHSTLGHSPVNPRVASTLPRPHLSCFQSRPLKPAVPEALLEAIQTHQLNADHGKVSFQHQQLFIYRCFKLKQQDLNWISLSLTDSPKSYITWCPTVFLCSLLAALKAGLAERTLIRGVPLPTAVVDTVSSSWNKSATI